MTTKERWLAAINMQRVDRLPFWPKLDAAYSAAQDAPFRQMSVDEIHQWIDSDRHHRLCGFVEGTDLAREVRNSTCVEMLADGESKRTLYKSKERELEGIEHFDRRSCSWYPTTYPVRDRDDILVMTEVFRDVCVELDEEALAKSQAEADGVGQDALVGDAVCTSPLMQWVEVLAGPANAHLLLADYEDETKELFAAMQDVAMQRMRLFCEYSPSDVLYLGENTSTTLISPAQFRAYCVGCFDEAAAICEAGDRILVTHMCGHLKALLPDLDALPVRAIEAFSSPPIGDTTLADGRRCCAETCFVGGTNAIQWLGSAEEIIGTLEADLDGLPHHRGIVISSAGVMPPACKPETIKQVRDWVVEYRIRVG